MKIIQINVFDYAGSTGRTCYEMKEYINSETIHDCYIACATGNKGNYIIGSKFEHKLHALFARITGKQGFYSKKNTIKLVNYMETIKPDIVHLRNLHSNYINLTILCEYLEKNNIATVITLHDCWIYTGGCCHYTLELCSKWKKMCNNCSRWRKDNSWFIDSTKNNFLIKRKLFTSIPRLAVIGVSNWVTNEAKNSFLKSSKIMQTIYNWVDLETFKFINDNSLKLRKKHCGKKIILSVATYFTKEKGILDFIELSKIMPSNYQIVLIGKIECDCIIPDNIDLIGQVNDKNELAKHYSAADVFVNLSLEETFGKVSAESLACGTPVICIDSTANKEIVDEGCGIVLSIKNITLLKEAIETICSKDKSYYQDICRSSAERKFNKNRNIEKYLAVYQELIEM